MVSNLQEEEIYLAIFDDYYPNSLLGTSSKNHSEDMEMILSSKIE
jgi:hypothetical protein